MPCYHPINVNVKRLPEGPGGIRVLDRQTVPCGQCLGCRAIQARDWAVRIMHEKQFYRHAWFLTLTYDEENLPQYGSLDSGDLRAFIKSLRYRLRPQRISYYAVGEYGDLSKRPHYHAVLFGPELLDRVEHDPRGGHRTWRSRTIRDAWPHGLSEFGTVTSSSASYISGYVHKKRSKKTAPNRHLRVDPDTGEVVELEPEFNRMSLRPAIGLRWIEKYWQDVYPRDAVTFNGAQFKPPRYYDKWMEKNHPEIMIDVRNERWENAEWLSRYHLKAAEINHRARHRAFASRTGV